MHLVKEVLTVERIIKEKGEESKAVRKRQTFVYQSKATSCTKILNLKSCRKKFNRNDISGTNLGYIK